MLSGFTASLLTLLTLSSPEQLFVLDQTDAALLVGQSCDGSPVIDPAPVLLLDATNYPDTVRSFLSQMRMAALCDDRETLVGLVQYPFTTYQLGIPQTTYHTPEALLSAFPLVFTDPVIAAMQVAQYETLFMNDQGSMIGNGEVWFHATEAGLKIKAINSNLYESDL